MATREQQSANRAVGSQLVFHLPVYALRVPLPVPGPTTLFSSTMFLIYAFAGAIVVGSFLLVLPVSSGSGQFTSPLNAVFTATSAVCLTGLVVVDTGTYWSTFGQVVIFILFQMGGIGFISGASLVLLALGGRLGLREKLLVTESMGLDRLGGVGRLILRVTIFSLLLEGTGAIIFYLHLSSINYTGPVLWTAVFHAVSAYNNCGMDIFGNFASLTGFQQDATILLTTAGLVFLGGIGYLVIEDIARSRCFAKLSLESKLLLSGTGLLLIVGTLFYLIIESGNTTTFGHTPFTGKALLAFFQSVTPRTAGFSAIDIDMLRQSSLLFTMLLMFIGGASGSAAGGVKINTFGVLTMVVVSSFRGSTNAEAFGRELPQQNVYRALVLFLVYIAAICLVALGLSMTEPFPFYKILFETFSALGTVGLSTGITPDLSIAGRIIITLAMFAGRLGALILMVALAQHHQPDLRGYPHESVRIG